MAATSRINAYRGLRSLFYLHKPSAAKKDYSTRFPALQVFFWHFYKIFLRNFYVMPKVAFVERVFNRVHGFWGKKSCFSGKLQREKLLLCRGRTCAARSCKVNGHLREGRGPGACRRTTSADSLQANTLVRLFARRQTLFAPVSFHSTVVLRLQPRNARPLQLSWAAPARPPASRPRWDEADRAQRDCIQAQQGHPCPAREVLALTSQHDLIKCKAAVRL